MPLAEFPFPESFEAIPPEIARFIDAAILTKNRRIHETPPELFKWLFMGAELAGRRVHYGMAPRDIWALVIDESKRWNAEHPQELVAGVGA